MQKDQKIRENSEVLPQMRSAGWNVQSIIRQEPVLSAGLYLQPGTNQVTFRRLVHELSLCLEFIQSKETPNEFWKRVAFAWVPSLEISLIFVTENTSISLFQVYHIISQPTPTSHNTISSAMENVLLRTAPL